MLKKYLVRFKFLSTREKTGIEIIKNIVNKEVELLPDPVVGLSDEEWRSFYRNNSKISVNNYILLHFLNKPNEHSLSLIINFINKTSLPVVCFFGNYGYFDNIKDISFIDGTVYDYLYLIDNAKYILTDSFHTAQFSIVFKRQFFIFERNYNIDIPQSDRIIELINKYECFSSYINKSTTEIDQNVPLANNKQLLFWKNIINNYVEKIIKSIQSKNKIAQHNDCSNCGACGESCPVNAIKDKYSRYHYKYKTIIKNKCINCNVCNSKCSIKNDINYGFEKIGYAGYSKDNFLRKNAASGGMFAAMAKFILNNGGVVYGAHLTLNGKHTTCNTKRIDKIEDLPLILNSKYVECDLSNCFKDIKDKLDNNQIVLVGSTSCKINGLLNYLGKRYENLYTVDLICHGTPSIILFRKNIKYLEKKYKGKVIEYTFKQKPKEDANEWIDFCKETFVLQKGNKRYVAEIPYRDSVYLQLFISGKIYRDKCYFCDFASINKPADITIGDYFELRDDYPEIIYKDENILGKGVNSIIANTQKGYELINSLCNTVTLYRCSVKKIEESHFSLYRSFDYDKTNTRIRNIVSKYGINNYLRYLTIKRMYQRLRHIAGHIKHTFLK